MKTECFVPIKANSERVPGKILENLMERNCIHIYVSILNWQMYSMMYMLILIGKNKILVLHQ